LHKSAYVSQNEILNRARVSKTKVTVILVNGFRMNGLVLSFDRFTILLKVKEKQHLVFKHVVSTVVPSKEVKLPIKDKLYPDQKIKPKTEEKPK